MDLELLTEESEGDQELLRVGVVVHHEPDGDRIDHADSRHRARFEMESRPGIKCMASLMRAQQDDGPARLTRAKRHHIGECQMCSDKIPNHYESLKSRFPKVMEALKDLGGSVRSEGPLNLKTSHLIQLAAAAVIQSEGGVHSHTRRAMEAGASPDEIYHALILLISPAGFPKVAAAISWADDIVKEH